MRASLTMLSLGLILHFVIPVGAQVMVTTSAEPVFPAEAGSYLYGDSVQVGVEVDKMGKVTRTVVIGPLVPCANRRDKVVDEIRNAAESAAKETVFQPKMINGRPEGFNVMLTYKLTPEKLVVDDFKKPVYTHATSLPQPAITDAARATRLRSSGRAACSHQ